MGTVISISILKLLKLTGVHIIGDDSLLNKRYNECSKRYEIAMGQQIAVGLARVPRKREILVRT